MAKTMTIKDMECYLSARGFVVTRKYIPEKKVYKFSIGKDGYNRTYYWEYVFDNDKKIQALENMMRDFHEHASFAELTASPKNLFGSLDDGYVYEPSFSFNDSLYEYVKKHIQDDIRKASWLRSNPTIPKLPTPVYARREIAIKNVIFNDPATIVFWSDDSKTVVKAHNEPFDPEKGLAMAITKKFFGNEGNYYNNVKKWLG